jgi:hypothetical protein
MLTSGMFSVVQSSGCPVLTLLNVVYLGVLSGWLKPCETILSCPIQMRLAIVACGWYRQFADNLSFCSWTV